MKRTAHASYCLHVVEVVFIESGESARPLTSVDGWTLLLLFRFLRDIFGGGSELSTYCKSRAFIAHSLIMHHHYIFNSVHQEYIYRSFVFHRVLSME
jgi:hypothetical protein